MASEAGKGDKRRKGDNLAFDNNFGTIFGERKPVRGSWIWDSAQGKMVSKDEYVREEVNAPMVIGDIQPYQSMATGEMIMSRSKHRNHLKQHGLIEVGNETKHLETKAPKADNRLKEQIAREVYAKLRY